MSQIITFCAGLLLALFVAIKLLGGKSLNRIKARTVGHGQHGSARWATRREIKSYYTMVPYEPQKWRMAGLAERGGVSVDDASELQAKYKKQNARRKKNINNILQSLQPGSVLGSFQHGSHGKKITVLRSGSGKVIA